MGVAIPIAMGTIRDSGTADRNRQHELSFATDKLIQAAEFSQRDGNRKIRNEEKYRRRETEDETWDSESKD